MHFVFFTLHAGCQLHNTSLKHTGASIVDLFRATPDLSATIKSLFGSVAHILVKRIHQSHSI